VEPEDEDEEEDINELEGTIRSLTKIINKNSK
jgi:hypothetical protein